MGVNYFFTDCTTTGGSINECYHPEHPLTRAEGAKALNQALSKVAALDMVVGSERGKWWATKSTHVFEGIETLIEYGGRYYGSGDSTHWVGPYLKEKPGFKELCLGYDFNPARRLPLFQLVYHGIPTRPATGICEAKGLCPAGLTADRHCCGRKTDSALLMSSAYGKRTSLAYRPISSIHWSR